jgi:hypothetical protein
MDYLSMKARTSDIFAEAVHIRRILVLRGVRKPAKNPVANSIEKARASL